MSIYFANLTHVVGLTNVPSTLSPASLNSPVDAATSPPASSTAASVIMSALYIVPEGKFSFGVAVFWLNPTDLTYLQQSYLAYTP